MAFQPPVAFAHSPLLPSFLKSQNNPSILTVLQAHSRLRNVQTLSTALQPIVHQFFKLRFVKLEEGAVTAPDGGEEKETWVDWIGSRISGLQVDEADGEDIAWHEGMRCLEACSGMEGVAALLLIASTSDPSPLAALQQLHNTTKPFSDSRGLLVFYLIITPSPADPALLPSIQRAFGPHTGVLSLPTPLPTDAPITVPRPLPVPPPLFSRHSPLSPSFPQTTLEKTPPAVPLALTGDEDTHEEPPTMNGVKEANENPEEVQIMTIATSVSQAWHRFLREFVTQSLVPYMERTVVALHESYTSRRALPTRLLSLTSRRFFSSSAPATPSATPKSVPSGSTSLVGTPAGDRRLIEWAAMLGDFKEVAAVSDGIRREGKGVEDLLLLYTLTNPPPPPPASQAVSSLTPLAAVALKPPTPSTPASLLYRALVLARIDQLLLSRSGDTTEGMNYDRRAEVARWFVLAAGDADEQLAALLLARAAQWEPGRRRKAMWYALAGGRMERCGSKPLALMYLRRSYDLYTASPPTPLITPATPSELTFADNQKSAARSGFPIPTSVPRSLGRLLYTTHDTQHATRLFLDLLGARCINPDNDSPREDEDNDDEVLLEDFRLSYQSLQEDGNVPPDLSLPAQDLWIVKAEVNSGRQVSVEDDLLQSWKSFSKALGITATSNPKRSDVNAKASVDILVRNPLHCEVQWANVNVTVQGADGKGAADDVEVDTIEEVRLPGGVTTVISIPVTSSRISSLNISQVNCSFLHLLPITLPLCSVARRRLNDSVVHLRTPTYADPLPLTVEFGEVTPMVDISVVLDSAVSGGEPGTLAGGEWRRGALTFTNVGKVPVTEIWLTVPSTGEVWLDISKDASLHPLLAGSLSPVEDLTVSDNLVPPTPVRLPIDVLHAAVALEPGGAFDLSFLLHGQQTGSHVLNILAAFRADDTGAFHVSRAMYEYDVGRVLEVTATVRPSHGDDRTYTLSLEVENVGSLEQVQIDQITLINSNWQCDTVPVVSTSMSAIATSQVADAKILLRRAGLIDHASSQASIRFLAEKLGNVLAGQEIGTSLPPPVQLLHSHVLPSDEGYRLAESPHIQHFINSNIRNSVVQTLAKQFPLIPTQSLPYIFPLYTPRTAWLAVFYTIPFSRRTGCLVLGGLSLEAGEKLVDADEAARRIAAEQGGKGPSRSMYAETIREKEEMTGAVMASGWAREDDPLVVDVAVEGGDEFQHDFKQGPCLLFVRFTLRNFSSSRSARFTLRLPSSVNGRSVVPPYLPPPYVGLLTHRGTLEPMSSCIRTAKLSVVKEGEYTLGGWRMEIEVGDGLARFVQQGRDGMVKLVKA